MTHDGPLEISLGKHRKETAWKNTRTTWAQLCARLANTHRTAETVAEYAKAKKSRQDEIKDVGGFVGGYVVGGRRKAGSVIERQLITLDIDFATSDFWDTFTLLFDCAACLYSTHKHTPESPRLRLILPLSEPVDRDQYEAIARRVAGDLGIELFDPTTFQPERLMYWPSTSKDGEYVYLTQDGAWLDAQAVLASYKDWTDASQWPVSDKVDKLVRRSMDKQGDPLDKPGAIGAFCRTYTIHDAIDSFLGDVYERCPDGRYSYKHGSTAGGVVTYDDKYAYSHHGTDPASGKLCNAFDLVRLHLYGSQDSDAAESTPVSKLPSYKAMLKMASEDPATRSTLIGEQREDAREAFASVYVSPGGELSEEPADDSWMKKLDIDRTGVALSTIDNICIVLENDPYFRGRIAFDEFEKCEVAMGDLPWRQVSWGNRRLTDRDDASIRHYLERAYGIAQKEKMRDAMQVLSIRTAFHPVKDYLNAAVWDGQERVETLLVDYLGAEDSDYVRTVTRKTLVAAVARIFNPGVKFDTILVTVGPQGVKKSMIFGKLGGRWFSDSFSFSTLAKNETKATEQIQGAWIVEIPEMSGMAKAEVEHVKHFVSKREDRYRVAYGHRVEFFPRQCIFVGTTNEDDFLRDTTGNRRYWPVRVMTSEPVADVDRDLTDDEVAQIWAEAVYLYKAGEELYLTGEQAVEAAQAQRAHTKEHPWTGPVQEYLDTKLPAGWDDMAKYDRKTWLMDFGGKEGVRYRGRVCIHEIWYECLGKHDIIDERSANALRGIMALMPGWKEEKSALRFGPYGRIRRGYIRSDSPYFNEKEPLDGWYKGGT